MAQIETCGLIWDVHFKRVVQNCAGMNSPWGGFQAAVGWIGFTFKFIQSTLLTAVDALTIQNH
ncbi:hypothetical protein GIB67_033071, partial [Kingdonia uniflora]